MGPDLTSLPFLMMATLSHSFSATSSTGGKEDSAAALADLVHDLLEQEGGLGVKAGEGLIHDEQLWRMDQCRNNRQFLFHPVGIGGHRLGQIGA